MFNAELLVNETLRLFHKKGVRSSMEELATILRISKRTLYEQVGSKADLISFVMDYYTKEIDAFYQKIINNEEYDNFEKFEILLSAIPQKIFFNEYQLNELKTDFPVLYKVYCEKIDRRWDKLYQILDRIIENDQSLSIDKKVFRMVYMSSLNGISKIVENDNTLSFGDLVKSSTRLLLSGLSSTATDTIGGVKLLDLLSNFSIGVSIFALNNGIKPIYLSQGYYELYDNKLNIDDDVYSNVYSEDKKYFLNQINEALEANKPFNIIYRVVINDEIRWHHTRALPIIYSNQSNIFLAVIIDITDIKKKEEEVRINAERLKLAFEQTSIAIWECDINNHRITFSDVSKKIYGFENNYVENMPQGLIDKSIVHKDSVKVFTDFFNEIYSGKEQSNCLVQFLDATGNYLWIKLSCKTIFDQNHKPIKAIGISEKVGNIVDVKIRFNQEAQLENLLANELLLTIRYNVSKNKLIRLNLNNSFLSRINADYIDNYSKFLEVVISTIANEEDKKNFHSLYDYENVIQTIEKGKNSTHINYRYNDEAGNIKWVSYTINLLSEPISGDYYLFGYIRDIDTKMKLELSLSRKVEYDVTTRLYLNQTMRKMTDLAISKQQDARNLCAFVIMEISNFSNIKRQYGLDVGEKLLFYIGRILRICFNNKNIVGRISDNQFAIFFPVVEDVDKLKPRVEDVISMAHNSYMLTTNEERITLFRTSIYVSSIGKSNYVRLSNDCLKLLSQLNDQENENIDIIDNIEDVKTTNNLIDPDINFNIEEVEDNDISMLLSECAVTLPAQTTIQDSIYFVLNKISTYYQAYRVSIFEVDLINQCVNLTYEHTLGSKDHVFDAVRFLFTDIPGFYLLCKKKRFITVNNIDLVKKFSVVDYELLKKNNINSIYLCPLLSKNEIIGYLCVSEPSDHIGEKMVLSSLSYFISSEIMKWRFQEKERFINENDVLTQLYNHNSFRKRVNELKKMVLTSLGSACVYINNLRQINLDEGSEYGDSMIMVISQALQHQFQKEDLYRYDSERFQIICPDINYHMFNEKIKKIITEINDVYPNLVSIGYTWSDTDIDIEKLIIHSEELMVINKSQVIKNNIAVSHNEKEANLQDAINNNWFEVYLQPKYDLNQNIVCGAEALIRLNHPIYGLITPAKIIPVLEREGLVSFVDLLVLEKVCEMLSRWKKEKRKLYPIAVNYSRVTLLEKNIIQKTMNIINKYKVDNSLIEIEITETIGNMEQKIIADMANDFITAGLTLAIDDFGSKFSSLSTLSLIPFNVVKLDKSIVNDLVINPRSQVIVEYVIMMCKKLNMKSVAEGIETELQFEEIKQRGCDFAQGYYFEKPIPITDFEEKYNQKK